MRRLYLTAAATLLAVLAAPVPAQIFGSSQPKQPIAVGIDALRLEFRAQSGSDTVYFGDESYELGAIAKQVLAAQAMWIRQHPEIVVKVEGYADASDTRDHALAIAAGRASEVRDYLILMGVPSTQVSATAWGKERIAVMGYSPQALAANRRVQTVLVR